MKIRHICPECGSASPVPDHVGRFCCTRCGAEGLKSTFLPAHSIPTDMRAWDGRRRIAGSIVRARGSE